MNIDYDIDMDRHYIPVHPNWEIQTKGRGSSFRIAKIDVDKRWLVTDKFLHPALEEMARNINDQLAAVTKQRDIAVAALKLWARATDNAEECEFDEMAAYTIPMPLFCDADEATEYALSQIEGEDRV